MFEIGEQAELRIPVTVLGIHKEDKGWTYRVRLKDFSWSFLVSEKDLKKIKINICEYAPFPKCNNGEGCDTCQFEGDD